MMTLSSTGALVAALRDARDVSVMAYLLPAGHVLEGLVAAAQAGAHVRVHLEGAIYKDGGGIGAVNRRAIAQLRAAGADVQLMHDGTDAADAMAHAKVAIVDGALFLDDRNFPDGGADTIVRDDFARDVQIARDALDGREDRPTPFFAFAKREALASEARLLHEVRRGDNLIVESESFGAGNRVYTAIDDAARSGAHVRLLVNRRDLVTNAREHAALARLAADGVAVRVCDGDEKFAVVRDARGWLGSANATAAFDHPDALDWGVRTDAPAIVTHLRDVFDQRWQRASALA
jgi:phosphatidylserine/phosphatidylglycerophosphate/cardiolipin synthase-like enzyme